MKKGDYLSTILRSKKTVFSLKDLALLWNEPSSTSTRVRLHYYIKKGDLVRIRGGLYAKNRNYNKLELATRILTPAYVSFETVLAKEGLIFQYYETIYVASYTTREIEIDKQIYAFRKVKDTLLMDETGIIHDAETSVANKERAFLDILYVSADYYFDDLRSLDWERVFDILPIYGNQRLVKKVNNLYKEANAPG
jgi:predicted transcriptional regulator of viral defense system